MILVEDALGLPLSTLHDIVAEVELSLASYQPIQVVVLTTWRRSSTPVLLRNLPFCTKDGIMIAGLRAPVTLPADQAFQDDSPGSAELRRVAAQQNARCGESTLAVDRVTDNAEIHFPAARPHESQVLSHWATALDGSGTVKRCSDLVPVENSLAKNEQAEVGPSGANWLIVSTQALQGSSGTKPPEERKPPEPSAGDGLGGRELGVFWLYAEPIK
ncbi:hypothetical protein BKA93DRAFT_750671 [Sparassis latifolia]